VVLNQARRAMRALEESSFRLLAFFLQRGHLTRQKITIDESTSRGLARLMVFPDFSTQSLLEALNSPTRAYERFPSRIFFSRIELTAEEARLLRLASTEAIPRPASSVALEELLPEARFLLREHIAATAPPRFEVIRGGLDP
jgi:hypothetical protein